MVLLGDLLWIDEYEFRDNCAPSQFLLWPEIRNMSDDEMVIVLANRISLLEKASNIIVMIR
jgi:hypothetical protein